jgi:toxin secretion/phage lysis holin
MQKIKIKEELLMKQGVLTILGAIGAFVSSVFGGWDAGLTTLVIFMIIDYLTGLIVAGVFHKSGKTENGALSSKAGLQGIAKKIMTLLMVLVAVRLDIMTGTNYVRDAVIIALCGNELISIIENAGLMGIPIPRKLKEAIEVLSRKGEE